MTNIFVKHWRLVSLGLGVVVALWVLYLLRTVLLPFAIGLVLAYLLMPFVCWLEKHLPPRGKWPNFRRIISVLIALILLICIIGGFAYFVVTAVIDASVILLESAPSLIGRSLYQVQAWFEGIIEDLPVEIQQQVKAELVEGGISLGQYIRRSANWSLVNSALSLIIDVSDALTS